MERLRRREPERGPSEPSIALERRSASCKPEIRRGALSALIKTLRVGQRHRRRAHLARSSTDIEWDLGGRFISPSHPSHGQCRFRTVWSPSPIPGLGHIQRQADGYYRDRDPVFNLSVRDNLIAWDSHARGERLVNIMDAYVPGFPCLHTMRCWEAKWSLASFEAETSMTIFLRRTEDDRNNFETGEKGASSGCDDFVFHGAFICLQQTEAWRHRIFPVHRLHRRLGSLPYSG